MLATALPAEVFTFMVVFTRVSAVFMMLPGLSEAAVPARLRLSIGVFFASLIMPLVPAQMPPDSAAATAYALTIEVLVGMLIGLTAKIIFSALETAGMIMGIQIGFANAVMFNPEANQQAGIGSVFMIMGGIMALLASDLYHLPLWVVLDSYRAFPVGDISFMLDASNHLTRMLSTSFVLAMQLAAPMLLVGVLMNVATGILSRLMPQFQVFFLLTPVQIGLGLLVLMLTLGAGLKLFITAYQQVFQQFGGAISGF
jgi:flagellar biosynthesis protein FliR